MPAIDASVEENTDPHLIITHFSSPVKKSGRLSLLPPDNDTGNFVKVMQRVPVQIKLDDKDNGGESNEFEVTAI